MPLPECKNPTSHAFIVGRGSEARHGRKDGQTDRQTDTAPHFIMRSMVMYYYERQHVTDSDDDGIYE